MNSFSRQIPRVKERPVPGPDQSCYYTLWRVEDNLLLGAFTSESKRMSYLKDLMEKNAVKDKKLYRNEEEWI